MSVIAYDLGSLWRAARGSESRFGDFGGPAGWNPKRIARRRGCAWYTWAVRNVKKEILVQRWVREERRAGSDC